MRIGNVERFTDLMILHGGLFRTKKLPGTNELRRAGLSYPAAKKLLEILKSIQATPEVMIEEGTIEKVTLDDFENEQFTMW